MSVMCTDIVRVAIDVTLTNLAYFFIDMVDPETKHSPSWKVTPKYVETATEGRSKTLYCFAIGR